MRTPKDNPLPPPGFASAAKALRAKIRACAARSFAARQSAMADNGTTDEDAPTGTAEPALLAGRAAQRPGPGRMTHRL